MKRVSREKLCVLAGVAAAVCGLVGVLFVPHFAHRTYISDNSLLPGVASVQFGRADMEYASRVTRAYIHCHNASERHALVLEKMAEIGLETYSVDETLVWGILRAPSAEGKESVALATHTTADTLAPVSLDGPFYAWPLYPGGCSTLGGPKKNTEANVVDCNDQPIPRLYAAGCFGSWPATRTASRAETTPRTWCGAASQDETPQASKRGTPKPSRPAPPSPSPCAPAPSLSRGAFRF